MLSKPKLGNGREVSIGWAELNAALMPAAVEVRVEEDAEDLLGHSEPEHPRPEAEHVGVVVAPCHLGGEGVVAERAAHAGVAVDRHAHAEPGAADQNAEGGSSALELPGELMGEIRVVDRIGGERTEIPRLSALLLHQPQAQ